MNNPLNELSAVYNQNIAEGCGCDEKKKVKDEMVPQGKTPLGGDGARPGKNKKGYIEPMGENRYVSWRDELREVTYGTSSVDKDEVTNTKSQDSDSSRKEIKEKNIKNKIKINPPQGVTEGFKALGGTVVEMYELSEADMTGAPYIKDHKKHNKINVKYDQKMKVMAPTIKNEKLDLKKADMGEVIKDFRKSDAPQFKGKSDKKIQKMAIAAKLEAEDGVNEKFIPPYEPLKTVTDDQRKKRELAQKTKDHDDKMSGKLAEGGMSIEDQMRISREAAAKRKPYQPGDRQKQRAAQVKQMAKNAAKDTRTDAQKMADATGPRPGSRYRGD